MSNICSTICAVKYLYKLVHKGHDRAVFRILPQQTTHDINNYSLTDDSLNLCEEHKISIEFDNELSIIVSEELLSVSRVNNQ